MGWRGTIRSVGTAVRAAERSNRRRAREHDKRLQIAAKEDHRQRAEDVVRSYEELVRSLVSAHRSVPGGPDWRARASAPPPSEPTRTHDAEVEAQVALDTYSPSRLTRWFGNPEDERSALSENLSKAQARDAEAHEVSLAHHRRRSQEHADARDLAERLLEGDSEATLEYLKALNPYEEIASLGESLRLSLPRAQTVAIELEVHGEEVVPKDVPRLLQSGRLSVKPMAKGDYYRLYQDHVCSAALRVASETFAAVPVKWVVVTAVDDLLDSSTGHLTRTAILSVAIPRDTLDRINLPATDPSEAIAKFKHVMDFRATSGFRPVAPIDAATLA